MFRPFRLVLAALATVALLALTSTGYAGPNETAFLQKYVGTWKATGEMTGADAGKITCKITFKGSNAKVNFSGRCTLTGMGSQSFTGTLSYNEAKKRYESKSSGKIAVGVKDGNSLVFSTTAKNPQGKSTSAMRLNPNALVMDTTITSSKGEISSVHLAFSKS